MMPESEVLSQMGVKGMEKCVEALSALLISAGYIDSERQLRWRWDELCGWDEDEH